MEKFSILMVHNYYQIPGGEDTVFKNEKELLEENGHNVITYVRSNNEIKSMKLRKILLPFITIFNIKTYIDIKKIIKKNNIDIVHVHNTLNLISPAVFYAARRMNVSVVQTIHNFRMICPNAILYRDNHICEDCPNKGLKCAIKNKCYRNSKLQTFIIVLMTKIHRMTGIYKKINYICLTEFNKQKLLQQGQIKEDQIYVKPNFSNNNLDIVPANKRLNQFVYVGRLEKNKGIDLLLKEWKNVSDFNLIICGSGPLEEWISNYIKNNNLNNVEFKGFISNKEVIKIISVSRGLVLATQLYEGFPMTIIESFSVGTPVICNNIGNSADLVKVGINGYKFTQIDQIKTLLSFSGDLYENTYKYYLNNYIIDINYETLMSIYDSILSVRKEV